VEDAGNGAGWELLDGSDSIYVTASRKQNENKQAVCKVAK
jgi:hypothetical protein